MIDSLYFTKTNMFKQTDISFDTLIDAFQILPLELWNYPFLSFNFPKVTNSSDAFLLSG